MWKRLTLICTLGAIAGIVIALINPVLGKALKLALLGWIFTAWAGVAILTWKHKPLRIFILILPLVALAPFLLPGRQIDPAELRHDYVRRMTAFEGAPYYWGGESSRGIDCSGLPRKALRDSLFAYGLRHFNGAAFRAGAEQWWYDASAKALGEGYRDYTTPVSNAPGTIREMDYGALAPGDLAVTVGGLHILAYAGQDRWIQADPDTGSVITLDGRSSDNHWFRTPVTTHRWNLLAPP